jgi:uncharacterized protein
MASNLKGRLARIKSLGLVKAKDLEGAEAPAKRTGSSPREAHKGERPDFLDGWTRKDEFLWSRILRYSWEMPSGIEPPLFAPLASSRRRSAEAARHGSPPMPGRVAKEDLRFFDLETTGLSGGTGTIAFLAAVGRVGPEGFEIEQLFIEDFPGERAFVLAILGLLEGGVVATYNGKSFDLPLLRTRCVMNAVPSPAHPQVDALFAARRLWKGVHGGASLELLGREVLGLEREEDIPGSMIPAVWLDYARTGEAPLMRLVMSHNADDVLALAKLVARMQAAFDSPGASLASRAIDRAGLGRMLLAAGREPEGEELLEAAAGDGDERAALFAARRYRLAGRVADSLRAERLLPRGYAASVERAKLYERLLGELSLAREWALEAMRLAPDTEERAAAERRLKRIRRKLELRRERGGP